MCEYIEELRAFDSVAIAMRLADMARTRLTMTFDYLRERDTERALVARGEQVIACMVRAGGQLVPAPVPPTLVAALEPYATKEQRRWASM
jgi:enediyne biosynthesis thioesterase